MTIPQLNADLMPVHRDDLLRSCLEELPEMKSVSAHRWEWKIDENFANVDAEADRSVRIAVALRNVVPAGRALVVNDRLPGNLRYATYGRTPMLIADTLVDGHAHL